MDRKTLLETRSAGDAERRAIVAGRLRTERREFFVRIASAENALRAMLTHYSGKLAGFVSERGHDPANFKRISQVIHDETIYLRASLRIWIHAAIRDSVKMGFRHIGDALLPIFKDNRESMEREILADRAIFESLISSYDAPRSKRLTFKLQKGFASKAKPTVALSSQQWAYSVQRIITSVAKKSLVQLRPSDRIWDLTTRSEQDLKRIVANGLGQSENPAVIARRIRKYVSPEKIDPKKLGVEPGPGVYRSPYKNAMRVARTEMNRAYMKSAVKFATDKPWVSTVNIDLSRVHTVADECDTLAAGGPYTPQKAEELIPAHPHCGCSISPNIDPKYLGEDEPV